MVAEECGFFFIVSDDCARGFEQGDSVVLRISVYALDFLPKSSGVCVMIQFPVEGFPGFLFMEDKLCFDSGLESVYFCLGVG